MKKLAILGSSGGNLYRQGGADPYKMLEEMFVQSSSAGFEIAAIQFIGAKSSMDGISMDGKAQLFTLDEDGKIKESTEKTLKEVNEEASVLDSELADKIRKDEIDGLILLSCDPKGVNRQALMAAADKKIPVAGTGGTSMADAQALGCRIIAASGTTGTTNRTRAVSAVAAFAKEWDVKYRPIIGSGGAANGNQSGSVWKRINLRGIMMASMPGFIAMALVLALSKVPGLGSLSEVFDILVGAIPIMVSVIASKQISGMDEVGMIAGVIAGTVSVDGGLIGGIVVGILSGIFVNYLSQFCYSHKVPGTTTNIVSGGLGGLVSGVIGKFVIAPFALWLGDGIKYIIDSALNFNSILAGLLAGFFIWFAIMGGIYHAAILPIVLLEMETTGNSFLGAVDLCGLVMVCAGIQLANIVKPRHKGDRTVCIPNLFVNLAFGTFVEAAYPYMFASKKIFASAIAAASLSGIAIGIFGVRCTAYVPCFVAPFVSNDTVVQTILCMAIAMGSAFVFTLISNIVDGKK